MTTEFDRREALTLAGAAAAALSVPAAAGAAARTPGQFERFLQASPPGCSVADWQCVRSTSYVYPGTISNAQAAAYEAQGFEIALHLTTDCGDFTRNSLAANWAAQHAQFSADFPGLAPLRTNRTHCIAWSDWASEPIVERTHGVRLDTNYYYWPSGWMLGNPGMFTGPTIHFPDPLNSISGYTADGFGYGF